MINVQNVHIYSLNFKSSEVNKYLLFNRKFMRNMTVPVHLNVKIKEDECNQK